MQNRFLIVLSVILAGSCAMAADKPRARDLGVPFDGTPGPLNAITDVAGIEVGHTTIIEGSGDLVRGQGPVRTGVTAILPRGKSNMGAVFAGWFSQNGNGEMTGTTWIEESGQLWGPVMITNTHSVGIVHDAVIEWGVTNDRFASAIDVDDWWSLPVVGETWDGWLNDLNGFHVTKEHAFSALDTATGGPVAEGNVGGGTGMICYEFKGGIGTASRELQFGDDKFTLGVLVQANFGWRSQLQIAGVPVGKEIPSNPAYAASNRVGSERDMGSIIAIVATDAPLLPHQLKRIARRVSMGVARTGGIASDSSGDIFLAFSTNAPLPGMTEKIGQVDMLPNPWMTKMFEATVHATEEAIINAMVAAETMTGINDRTVNAIPHDELQELLRKYNRLN